MFPYLFMPNPLPPTVALLRERDGVVQALIRKSSGQTTLFSSTPIRLWDEGVRGADRYNQSLCYHLVASPQLHRLGIVSLVGAKAGSDDQDTGAWRLTYRLQSFDSRRRARSDAHVEVSATYPLYRAVSFVGDKLTLLDSDLALTIWTNLKTGKTLPLKAIRAAVWPAESSWKALAKLLREQDLIPSGLPSSSEVAYILCTSHRTVEPALKAFAVSQFGSIVAQWADHPPVVADLGVSGGIRLLKYPWVAYTVRTGNLVGSSGVDEREPKPRYEGRRLFDPPFAGSYVVLHNLISGAKVTLPDAFEAIHIE